MDNTTQQTNPAAKGPEVIVLKFADSKIPVFKETRNKDYIVYGEKNQYPEYLTYLFDKSPKHNAIVSGKARYIFGKGYANGNTVINRKGESLNDISKKSILDVEMYGGYYWEVIWNKMGTRVVEIYHVDYTTIRKAKDGGYYWKESWDILNRDEPEYMCAFDPNKRVGSQIYAYGEYRPKVRFYPLPGYIGSNNFIETDIEISKYYLSAIRNGMMPSKMIQFFNGIPTGEGAEQIEKRMYKKFGGAENAGRFFLIFNETQDSKAVEVNDMSATDLDKHFIELNKVTQQEIFSGHQVVSPMLFGIKTEGQLGGNTEMATAYELFQNTYSRPKAESFDKEVEYVMAYSLWPGEYELQSTDPIGVQFDIKDVIQALPRAFVYQKLGIPEDQWNLPTVGDAIAVQTTTPAVPAPVSTADASEVNDNIKNLTGKQHQQVMRVIRQHAQGKLNDVQAKALLRAGYGLTEDDINQLLGIQTVAAMSFEEQEDGIVAMFDACGESKQDFEIVKSKRVSFSHDIEVVEDEALYIQEAFKSFDVTATENRILELIKKDSHITAQVIADAISQTVAFVESKLASLAKRGYLEQTTEMIGEDEIIERSVPEGVDYTAPPPRSGATNPTQVFIKYSYEGPVDNRNRPFCRKMMALNRLYSRAEIELISQRLGYSVFDRRGGFWRHKDGTTTPYCRHNWKSNIVVKKGGDK